MEDPQTSRIIEPPDNSKRLLKLPKAPNITIDGAGNVTIAPEFEEGYNGCQLDFETFCLQMLSSSAHLESISIEYSGSDHLWQLCKIVNTMSSLKDLQLVLTHTSCVWAELVSELLSKVTSLLKFTLDVPKMNESEAKSLVDVLLHIRTLQTLNLTLGSTTRGVGTTWIMELPMDDRIPIKQLCRYLRSPANVLTHLDILTHLHDMDVRQLADVLSGNKCLKYLAFKRCKKNLHSPSFGVGDIGDALHSNKVLETLDIHDTYIWGNELNKLVAAIVPNTTTGVQPNSSLSHLNLKGCEVQDEVGMEQMATMVKYNTSLVHLGLRNWVELRKWNFDFPFQSSRKLEDLLISLQSNKTLKYLDLSNNIGIAGTKILGMIMDMLLHNRTILVINLHGTSLEYFVEAETIHAELRKRKEDCRLWLAIPDMAPICPNSARIFLCGNGEAGKTTLCQKWAKKKKRDKIAKMLGKGSQLANVRTRGIEVHKLVWGDMSISVWDMAGQEEYHSFHDLVVPNDSATESCCLYFIVCNPYNRPLHNIKAEVHYWLKFVASNTRRSEAYRPHVTILMTHSDLWQKDCILTRRLVEIIVELKKIFINHLNFDDEKEFVAMDNGTGKSSDALEVKLFAENYLKILSTKVPKVIKATMDLQSIVAKWNAQHPHRPFVDWETFSKICEEADELKPSVYMHETSLMKKKQYVATSLMKKKQYVATALHEGGHILYYEDLSKVIMNPQWFCHDIMGNILFKCSSLNPNYAMISNGIISQKYLKEVFLDSLDSKKYNECFDDFLSIMMKLQICYEDADGNIMFPSLFPAAKCNISYWPSRMVEDVSSYHYIGTSLASKEPTATILTAGFFPRLQVYLQKFVPGIAKRNYKLSRDTISFTHRDSDVHIEYKNDRIDILSRSLRTEGYKLHQEMIKSINDLRSSSMLGCSGVAFEESILRPYCVQELCPYEVRWNQVVSRRELKQLVTSSGDLNYQHHWEENERMGLPRGLDLAESLLSLDDWQDVLESRLQALEMVEKAVTSKLTKGSSTLEEDDVFSDDCGAQSFGDPSDIGELKKYLENKFCMLDIKLDQHHDEVKVILRGLKKDIMERQEALCTKVCSNICALMEFSVQLIQSRVPKYPVFVPNAAKSMFKRMIPGLTSGRLYFFCEHREGFHLAPQLGISTSYGTAATRKFGIALFWGLSAIVMLLKVGAHLGAGMGNMIPPPQLKDFMTMLDTPGLLDMAQPTRPMLEFLPDDLKKDSTITRLDNQGAEDWLVEYLKSKCGGTVSSIHEKLGLNRVVYVNQSSGNSDSKQLVAWICDEHLEAGKRNGTLRPLGNSFCS